MKHGRFLFRYYSKQENRYLLNSEIQAIFGMSCLMQKVKDTGLQAVCVSLSGDNDEMYATEQCTGIYDCAGNPIFEGDVVKTVTGASGPVVWSGGRAGFVVRLTGVCCSLADTQKIVGNVHTR